MSGRKKICVLISVALIGLTFGCASTGNKARNLSFRIYQLSTRLFDLETRGEDTGSLADDIEKCRSLFQNKKYSEAEKCMDALIAIVNTRYQVAFPGVYVYEGVQFEDVFVETTMGRKVGFFSYPEKPGKYPGIIFLRGAGTSSIDLKRTIHSYAKKNYFCLAPEFNQDFLKGVVDLNAWYDIFSSHRFLDSQRTAVVSFSRGSYFAYKLITQDVPFNAWVNLSGVVYKTMADRDALKRNPVPLLVVHGKDDKTCPVEWAYNLENIYREAGIPIQMELFDNEGHIFSRKAGEESSKIVDAFLRKHLQPQE